MDGPAQPSPARAAGGCAREATGSPGLASPAGDRRARARGASGRGAGPPPGNARAAFAPAARSLAGGGGRRGAPQATRSRSAPRSCWPSTWPPIRAARLSRKRWRCRLKPRPPVTTRPRPTSPGATCATIRAGGFDRPPKRRSRGTDRGRASPDQGHRNPRSHASKGRGRENCCISLSVAPAPLSRSTCPMEGDASQHGACIR